MKLDSLSKSSDKMSEKDEEEGKAETSITESDQSDDFSRGLKRRSSQTRDPDEVSICRSDRSKDQPLVFNNERELPNIKGQRQKKTSASVISDRSKDQPLVFSNERELPNIQDPDEVSICRSDRSKDQPLVFSNERELLNKKTRSISAAEEQLSRHTRRQDVLMDPVYINRGLKTVFDEHKSNLRRRYGHVTEGSDEPGRGTPLNQIYTELHITEGQSEDVQREHEVWQMEIASKTEKHHDTAIRCQDIFKASDDQQRQFRVVLTSGVAGVGKTFSVSKFTLDWAEGLENQDVSLLVVLSFRELNLIRDQQYSLLKLLQVFHPALQKVTAEQLSACKLLFVLDGLDESRLSLDFDSAPIVYDVSQESSIDLLFTNLIKGNLLPSARIWITSRPAVAYQIPPVYVDRMTEVRGFTDAQKEEYFRRRLSDEELCSRIVSHIQTSRSLYVMCRVPVFCWIAATVLEHMVITEKRGELPQTMTDMYSHFLLVQTKRKKQKYHQEPDTDPEELSEADREVLLKLGRMAFEHLERQNIMFYQEDLEQCGLDETEASVYSGVCTEIFRRECVIFQKPIYSFIHLSIQEFLAAVYMFHCYFNRKTDVLQLFLGSKMTSSCVDDFVKKVLEKSLERHHGHLDLFVRFLHGLTLETNQRLLGDLLGQPHSSPETTQKITRNLKEMKTYKMSPDRSINIFHCLVEMKDLSVHREIQEFLKSEDRSEKELSEIHCSGLAYILQMSEEVLDELDLKMYNASLEGRLRLIPAVRNCRKARLIACGLTDTHCEIVASAMKSNPSHLTELTLRTADNQVAGVQFLCAGLKSPHCKLETLRFERSNLPSDALVSLFSTIRSNTAHLKHLDLRYTIMGEAAMKQLCEFLGSPDCKLETLGLKRCCLSELDQSLFAALKSNTSHLKHLSLSHNYVYDSGLQLLCGVLESPQCKLESLRLGNSWLTSEGCCSLASTLKSTRSSLKYLKLNGNHEILDLGVQQLCAYLASPHCRLETLRLKYCGMSSASCGFLVSALKSNTSRLKHLELTDNRLLESDVQQLLEVVKDPAYSLQTVSWKQFGAM